MITISRIRRAHVVVLAFIACLACTVPSAAEEPVVVATTTWTAAFCRAAGIDDVVVLTPSTLRHPPDYLLKPSDIPLIEEADIIVVVGSKTEALKP